MKIHNNSSYFSKFETNIENTLLTNRVILANQKDCIHERFSFMKELTENPNQNVL